MDHELTRPVLEFLMDSSTSEMKSFLGLVHFYRHFLKDLSVVVVPLREHTERDNSTNLSLRHKTTVFEYKITHITVSGNIYAGTLSRGPFEEPTMEEDHTDILMWNELNVSNVRQNELLNAVKEDESLKVDLRAARSNKYSDVTDKSYPCRYNKFYEKNDLLYRAFVWLLILPFVSSLSKSYT
ncbi:unnamed protein product [Lepeophtheirus salmonis]|uniref:(salmon louse) hypothetical protein n=1 Tax=Lepeophtheirus salmonis TaxID=72036 RepID=A0A7R8HBC7_LEPSM|nr:unnamed protein product [Lepeophtheirus salmonis]CAF2992303.1 unnamed protein product [Lepeophtheirus salmonis]